MDANVEKRLVDATTAGAPVAVAAAHAGVSERAFMRWMERGYLELQARDDGDEPNTDEDLYVEFYEKITAARAACGVRALATIQKCMIGGSVTEETVKKYRDHDGNLVEERTVKRTPPDWKAGAWYLERQLRADFGRQSEVALTGPGGGAVQVEHTVDLEGLADRVYTALQQAPLALTDGDELVVDAEPDPAA